MNTIKLVDIELVKEIRKYDRTLFLVGVAGFIFWRKLKKLEERSAKIEVMLEKYAEEEKMWGPKEVPKED